MVLAWYLLHGLFFAAYSESLYISPSGPGNATSSIWTSTRDLLESGGASVSKDNDAQANDTQTFPHKLLLDNKGDFLLLWRVDGDHVTFEAQVRTSGWLAFGFSRTGGMRQADLVIGLVTDDGDLVFQDYWSEGYHQPVVDKEQNWIPVQWSRNVTHTVIRFKRLLDTCDAKQDVKIENGTMKALWAFEDKPSPSSGDKPSHGGYSRGTNKIILLQFPCDRYALTEEEVATVQQWDIFAQNVTIKGVGALHWCWQVKAPVTTKHHVIAIEPVFSAGKEKYHHHYMLWVCRRPNESFFEPFVGEPGYDCLSGGFPSEKYCEQIYVGWAVGGGTHLLPHKAGIPLGEADSTYFLMQIHYNNPNFDTFVDSSGLRLHYTSALREHDAFMQNVQLHWKNLVIPPGLPDHRAHAMCDPECSRSIMPTQGINVVSAYLHSHGLGRKIVARHFRNGTELEPFAVDNNYDPSFQEMRYLRHEKKVLPEDVVSVECSFDSTSQNGTTMGGINASDEMCSLFFFYYPKMPDSMPCLSGTTQSSTLAALGIESADDKGTVRAPKIHKGKNWREVASERSRWTVHDVRQLQNAQINQKQESFCAWRVNELPTILPDDLLGFPGDDGYYEMVNQRSICAERGH